MPAFGKVSRRKLVTSDLLLRVLFDRVVEEYDCSILEGHRNESKQNVYFRSGRSKVQFPRSKHNVLPSRAVDVAPFPIKLNDLSPKQLARFYHFAGFVKGIAAELGIEIRWGGDWDSDQNFEDQTFDDLVHFELA